MSQIANSQNQVSSGIQQLASSDSLLSTSLNSSAENPSSATKLNTSQQLGQSDAINNNQQLQLNRQISTNSTGFGTSMYNNGYSSYGGGFGSSYGMGSMYGSSYGMGGMGSMYGSNMNMMNQNPQQQPGFRDEYQGVLNGFNSLLNIMGAGIGMIGYGSTFFHFAKRAVSFIFSCFSNFTYKILGIAYLKKLVRWMTNQNLEKDLTKSLETFSQAEKSSISKRIFGKLLVVVRVLSGLAILGMYFVQYRLRKRMQSIQKEHEMMQNFDSQLGPLIFQNEIPNQQQTDSDFITINMNQNKADIIDSLDEALNDEVEEEEKEIAKEQKDEDNIIEINDSSENSQKTDNLQDAFDSVIDKEKKYIQQTQVRSEEFWKHAQPSDFNSTLNTNTQANASSIPPSEPLAVATITDVETNESSLNQSNMFNQIPENNLESSINNYSFINPIANSYPQTNLQLSSQPQEQNLNESSTSLSSQTNNLFGGLMTSSEIIGGDTQQPKIFKTVSNRLKPWQK